MEEPWQQMPFERPATGPDAAEELGLQLFDNAVDTISKAERALFFLNAGGVGIAFGTAAALMQSGKGVMVTLFPGICFCIGLLVLVATNILRSRAALRRVWAPHRITRTISDRYVLVPTDENAVRSNRLDKLTHELELWPMIAGSICAALGTVSGFAALYLA